MPRIDTHAHVLPATYVAALPPQLAATHRPLPVEALDAVMHRYAIDAAVVSAGPPGVFFGDQGQAGELARILNEELAAVVRAAPQRFAALASLPLPDVDAASRSSATRSTRCSWTASCSCHRWRAPTSAIRRSSR